MNEDENPNAFPSKEIDWNESMHSNRVIYLDQHMGMTLRDYFAAKALVSMLDNPTTFTDRTYEVAAHKSYKLADAMLKERNK